MTLKTIVQDVCREVGLPVPDTVINNTDRTAVQMLGLLNDLGYELMEDYQWEALTAEGTFTTVATETQSAIAAATTSFHRMINETMFDRTRNWAILGPLNEQQWQFLKSTTTQSVRNYWRIRGSSILFYPTPGAGNSVYFEYIQETWCESSGGTGQTSFAADTDVGRIPEAVLKAGLKYRWKAAKGFEYAEDYATFQKRLANAEMRDGAKATISMGGRPEFDPRNVNIPDGSFTL